jgi:glycosyltransferase involved in cell wall biosynthesis
MNRAEFLKSVLYSWTSNYINGGNLGTIDRIIIVDWASTPPLDIKDERAEVLRIDDQDCFDGGKARNTAIRYCPTQWIITIDADIIIHPLFFNFLKNNLKNQFWFSRAPEANESLTGSTVFEKSAWKDAGGYPENLYGWGFEDMSFQDRLSRIAGRKELRQLKDCHLAHIPHSDTIRNNNSVIAGFDKYYTMNINKLIVDNTDYKKQVQEKQIVKTIDTISREEKIIYV